MSADAPLLIVPYGQDPLGKLAEILLDRHAVRLPDLSDVVVLLAHGGAAPRFRQQLLAAARRRGLDALLAPECQTLNSWVGRFADPQITPLSSTARELVLLAALSDHPEIVRRTGHWPLIDSLLALFDELELNSHPVPEDLADFTALLADGYGVANRSLEQLGMEARWVFVLWRAWKQQLRDTAQFDQTQAYCENLRRSVLQADDPDAPTLYLVGCTHLARCERDWAKAMLTRGALNVLLHGQLGASGYHPDTALSDLVADLALGIPASSAAHETGAGSKQPEHGDDAYQQLLDAVFATPTVAIAGEEIAARARRLAALHRTSPAAGRLQVREVSDAEHEAQAIDLQVRRWWLDGKRNIGIVTNDRKLGRRVRALLERANLSLRDAAGWPLSTTSAATALVRWLETVETDFAYAPLLDLLKSPFVGRSPHDDRARTVEIFEEGLLRRFNLASGLSRYRAALRDHAGALDRDYGSGSARAIELLLDLVESAARQLLPLAGHKPKAPQKYLDAIAAGLEILGVRASFATDEAGQRVLDELEAMRVALSEYTEGMSWPQFRAWLGRALERHHFRPPMTGSGVELMGLPDSRLYRFDAVIVAGALRDHLPRPPEYSAFFNDSVRRQLGLPQRQERLLEQFYDFRRLLQSAPLVLITLRREEDDQPVIPSLWVERLRAFHRLAYGNGLEEDGLRTLPAASTFVISCRDDAPLPQPTTFPRANTAAALRPSTISASSHQRLLDCPYQFFAADILALQRTQDIDEDVDKAGYGQRIHRILQAFHRPVPGLPGPFGEAVTEHNAEEATALLTSIGDAVFADDIVRSFPARAWRYRWRRTAPLYIRWQSQRSSDWTVSATEVNRRVAFDDNSLPTLQGRLDRLDCGPQGFSIIDYKTGAIAPLAEVLAGEQIQLPFYALLVTEPLYSAVFLALDDSAVREKVELAGDELHVIRNQVRMRLLQVHEQISRGAALPAWGDEKTCERCVMESLCRREMWV